MAFRLQAVAPARGLQWVRDGWRVFMRRPLAFTGLFVFFLFVALVSVLLPWIGPLLLLGVLPLLTLGFMIATRDALAGRFPTPGVFFAPLRGPPSRRGALIVLGAVYAVGTLLIMVLSDAVDGGSFEELQELLSSRDADQQRIEALLADPRLVWGVVLRFGLAALLSVPFWHAPALVHWGGQGAAQALFSSTLAVWRCRAAFMLYVVGWTAVITAFGFAAGVLLALVGARQAMAAIALPAGLLFSTVFYASLYFTFRDSFTDAEAPPALPAGA